MLIMMDEFYMSRIWDAVHDYDEWCCTKQNVNISTRWISLKANMMWVMDTRIQETHPAISAKVLLVYNDNSVPDCVWVPYLCCWVLWWVHCINLVCLPIHRGDIDRRFISFQGVGDPEETRLCVLPHKHLLMLITMDELYMSRIWDAAHDYDECCCTKQNVNI